MSLAHVLARRVRLTALTSQSVRSYAAYWNKDWQPGPAPKTEEERRAAARKYGMIPEDYEAYPDDGTGYGDYPKLPVVSAESRDPFYNYDYDEQKRNFGEPIHVEADMYGEDRLDASKRPAIPYNTVLFMFVAWMSLMAVLTLGGEHLRVASGKKMPKQYPGDGQAHYTFETTK